MNAIGAKCTKVCLGWHRLDGIIMNNVVLIGMPGTGKSTVGVILAKRLGYDFIDTDLVIAKKAGKTLPEILADVGIDEFLKLEGNVGKNIRCEKTVIATGGSMALREEAMQNLCRDNVVIWLDTASEELERRINASPDRGIAAEHGTTVADINAARRPFYEKYADIHIKCLNGTDNVVSQIREALNHNHNTERCS